jgi:hypothetical protein
MSDTTRSVIIAGSDLSGSDGAINRTYTLTPGTSKTILSGSIEIYANRSYLYQGSSRDFTVSGNTITFLVNMDDSDTISIRWVERGTDATSGTYYTDSESVVALTGVGVNVVDENVGTGDSSETDFDLDNDNIIDGTYTLYYGASGSNSMTDLVEGTDYSLDKDSGRILLTSTGVTTLGTNVLYAKYVYSPKITNSELVNLLEATDEEIDRMTGRTWGTPETKTEFFDGRERFTYPTTDEPYARDWDEPDFVQLKGNVTEINYVYFLTKGATFSKVYSDDGGSYTDNTSETNSLDGTAFNVFAATPADDDAIYFSTPYRFYGMTFRLGTAGVDSGSTSITWQYYNGSAWSTFTPTAHTTGADKFTASGKISWEPSDMDDWSKTSVNSSSDYYYIRAVATTADYSTAPTMVFAGLDNESVVQKEIAPQYYDLSDYGRLTFVQDRVPNGNRIVKVIYKHGETSTNPLIKELASLLTGIKIYAKITGGSYDDLTSYTIGRKTASVGEVYVNVAEVVKQYRARVKEIMAQLGQRVDIVAI